MERAARSTASAHPALRWNLPLTGGLSDALAVGKLPLEPVPGRLLRKRG
jgi:hypothetical protein